MIRNPWPLNWKPPSRIHNHDWSGSPCEFDKRHTLFCYKRDGSGGVNCKTCYMRQQSMSFVQMNREGHYIDRVCDRCGAEIPNPDTALYLSLEGRKGELIVNLEICRDCAAELADWLGGVEFPKEALDESIWD